MAELNAKQRLLRRWPLVFSLTAVVLFLGMGLGAPVWLVFSLAVFGCALTFLAYRSDGIRRAVVLCQVLYFFPDRVLVFDPSGVGAVGYRDLVVAVRPQRFIEDGTVPADARVVDHTWQYVNKSGGPDRRFNNNRQLPVCLYEEIHFGSSTGLNEVIQLSQQGPASSFALAIQTLASSLPEPSECVFVERSEAWRT